MELQVEQSLIHAQKAVQADEAYQVELAIKLYQKAIDELEEVAASLNEEQRHVTLNYVMTYKERIKVLTNTETSDTQQHLSKWLLQSSIIPSRVEDLYISPPENENLRPYWLLNILSRTIKDGAKVTPKLFIQKNIWSQHGAKLPGLSIKVVVLESVIIGLQELQKVPPPGATTMNMRFMTNLTELCEAFFGHEKVLVRSFPFLTESEEEESKEGSQERDQAALGKLTSFALGFGRMVKKQALAAVERVSAAAPAKVASHELDRYTYLICELAQSCKFLGIWQGIYKSNDSCDIQKKTISSNREMSTKIEIINRFLHVLCELLLQDVWALLDRYIKLTSRKFGRITWTDEKEELNSHS